MNFGPNGPVIDRADEFRWMIFDRVSEMPAHGSGQGAALDSGFSDGATPPPSGSFHPEDEDEDSDGRGKPVGASLKRAYFESEQRPAQASR